MATPQGWVMLHRVSSPDPVPVATGNAYYGPGPCGLPTTVAVTRLHAGIISTRTLGLGYVVDLAYDPTTDELAVVTRGSDGVGHYARLRLQPDDPACLSGPTPQTEGDPVEKDALTRYVYGLPRDTPPRSPDDPAAERAPTRSPGPAAEAVTVVPS